MYKVFFNDRVVILTDEISAIDKATVDAFFPVSRKKALKLMMEEFEFNTDLRKIIIFTKEAKSLKKKFDVLYNPVDAAGGLVMNAEGKLLVIQRHGKWDLPKGHLEPGEDIEHCALREVSEECGISGMNIEKFITQTYHIYDIHGLPVQKRTHWYFMTYEGTETPVPQKSESITQARWIDKSEIPEIIGNTYPSLHELFSYYLERRIVSF